MAGSCVAGWRRCVWGAAVVGLGVVSGWGQTVAGTYGKVPLSFEPNVGQVNVGQVNQGQSSSAVQWVARGPEYALFLSGHDAVLELNSIAPKQGIADRPTIESAAVRMNLLGANAVKDTDGEEPQAGKANYFTGRDPSKWLSEVPTFGKVRLREVYPGIDLVYYGRQGRLEYDFVVAPGADPGNITLGFEGAKAGLAENGDLVLPIAGDFGMGHTDGLRPTSQSRDVGHPDSFRPEVRFDRPVVYQMKDGVREPVAGGFRVGRDGRVSFALGKYDRSRELVIDPTLVFEGEIGTGNQQTIPTGMTVDSLGEMVITGYTNDLTFPTTTGAYQTTCSSPTDPFVTNGMTRCGASSAPSAFVTKLSADGASLIYSTYLHGGGGYEQGQSVVVDAAGDAYVLGSTSSNDFPITSNAYQTYCQPTHQFLSDNYPNYGPTISSQCDNFYNGGGTEYTVNGPSLFIAKLNPLGTALLYSTFFGGTLGAYPVGLALDSAGNMYFMSNVIGLSANNLYVNNQNSNEVQFPVTDSAYQGVGIGVNEVAVSELSADGQTLLYSTFLGAISGGSGHNVNGQAFAVGPNGIAYAGGYTDAINFPTTAGSFKPTCTVYANDNSYCNTNLGFVTAIDTTKSGAASLLYSSYLGGETAQGSNIPEQEVYGLAADANNDLFVTGYTYAVNFPTTTGAFQTSCPVQGNTGSCPETAFLTKINPAGSALTWSTFVGGAVASPPYTYGNAITLDSQGQVYLYGFSQDAGGFPQVNPVQTDNGGNKVFVTEFTADGTTEVFGTRFGTSSTTTGSGATPIANGIAVDAAGNMYITGYTNDGGTFGTTPGTYSTTATNGFNRTFFAKISPNTPPVPNNGLTTNLLLNPGAELGSIADWTAGGGGTPTVDQGTLDAGITPHSGSYDFVGGAGNPTDSLSQTVSIITQGITTTQVDGGTLFANVSFWEQGLNQGDPSDEGSVTLTFLNANDAAIGTVTAGPEDSHNGAWFNVTGVYAIPVGTRSITYTMNFIANVGPNNDGFIDDNVLSIHTETGLTISPAVLHFGNVPVGNESAPQTVTLTNQQAGMATINIAQIVSELGSNPGDFSEANNCPAALVAGASCTVTIGFIPDGVGAKGAGIAIFDDAVPAQQQIAVDGTGTGGILQVNPGNLKAIAGDGTAGDSGDGGAAILAELNQPNGVAFDPAGNLYIADEAANVIRKVDTTGKITTFAGDGTGGFNGDGGAATAAELLLPFSVASDQHGNIYIQDTGNYVIRRVDATTGVITTFAGTPGTPGHSGDGGLATAARFNQNQGARFDSAGNLYVPTCDGASVRKIDTAGHISTVAGNFTEGYSGDGGQATAAQLQCPSGVAIDGAGNFYIADEFNEVIRKVNTAGVISTIAGTPGVAGYSGDGGAATSATFNDPNDVVVDAAGTNLYVADSGNNRVRKIDLTGGIVTTAAGGLNSAGSAAVNTPLAVTLDTAGNVYFSDSGNSEIREIFPQGVQPFPATMVGSTAPAQAVTISNIGNVDVTIPSESFTKSGNAGDFGLTGGTCLAGATLAANGGGCTLTLTFAPTAVGQRLLTVSIASNALNTPQSFSIGGLGTSPASALTPTITWAAPAPITDATALSATQLDATATDANGAAIPGTFVYTPAAGSYLAAGTQTLSVTFTPNDQIAFTAVTKTVPIVVTFAPSDTLSPSVVVFPSEAIGATSKAVTISVIVASNVPQSYISLTGDFAQTNNCGSGQGNGSYNTACLIQVTFTPTGTGTRIGTLSVTPPGATALSVALSGVGLAAGTLPGSTLTGLGVAGVTGDYTFTGTVTGSRAVGAPTGSVSFIDTTANNAVLGSGTLGAATIGVGLTNGPSTLLPSDEPAQAITADFNGDGKPDVVVLNLGNPICESGTQSTLSIRLSNGDGTFTPEPDLSPGYCAYAMAVGDFNGDGKEDIALTPSGGSFTVYLGNGDGTFTAESVPFTGGGDYGISIASGDFNGDGRTDLVVGSAVTNQTSFFGTAVLLGQTDGSFLRASVNGASGAAGLVAADFNGDGKLDYAFESYDGGTVFVQLGHGDGTMDGAVSTSLTTQSGFYANGNAIGSAGDFNGDGKADLVVAGFAGDPGSDAFTVLLSNGDGSFTVETPVAAAPGAPGSSNDPIATTGDFNGDGLSDIAYLDDFAAQVFLSNGDGTFTLGSKVQSGDFGTGSADYLSLAAADFNGDGLPDLIGVDSDTDLGTMYFTQRTEMATATLGNVAVQGTGNHLVEAVYGGGSGFLTSTSAPATVAAGLVVQTITFGPLSNQTYPAQPIALTATASSGLPVSYSVTGPATVTGSVLTITGVGTVTVTASQPGNVTYAAATPVVQTFTVTLPLVATATTLVVTSGGSAVTTVAAGSVVTLTATVTSGSAPVAPGQVVFCDALATTCTDIHLLGTAQLTSAGTATFRFVPGIGTHSYKAVFVGTTRGTNTATGSASAAVALAVTGRYPTTTTIAQSGTAGSYLLTATTVGIGNPTLAPTGTVSFLDSSNANAVVGTGALGAGTAGLSFAVQTSTANVENPQIRSAVADFNGDGILDVATASTAPDPNPTIYANSVAISLGNGDGTFNTLETRPATGNEPYSIVAGDFNGDGKADLAVTNVRDATVTILLGNGDGTFTAAAAAQVAQNPYGLVTGDFNGDGNLDLAVSTVNGISMLLGNGDGTFVTSQITLPSASNEAYGPIATADFNGDGKADLVVEGYSPTGGLVVLLGNGDGTFATAPAIALTGQGSNLNGLVTGDFNGDGKPDFAATNSSENTVLIMLGNGDGTFATTAAAAATFYDPEDLQTGDFDGDGKLDLAVMHLGGSHEDVLLGNGDGTFTTAGIPTGVYAFQAITVGDFNGDGVPDIAATNGSTYLAIALTERTQTALVAATPVAPLGAGTHQVEANYPGDLNYGASVSSATSLAGATGTPLAPTITWAMPAPITTATPLSATQLDAAATDMNGNTVPGTYVYTPPAGTLLAAGTQALNVTFTPTDAVDFATATKTVSIVVTQATAATVTTLAVSSGGSAVTTVASGSVVTLTAAVTAGGNSVSPGQVAFCDATAATCTGSHLLGTAQLVGGDSTSTATYRFVPGIGTHSYKALFLGTKSATGSASAAAALAVTGTYTTATTIASTGAQGSYGLTATTVGTGSSTVMPTGIVSFLDTSNGNAVLGTSPLGAATAGFSMTQPTGSPVQVGTRPYGVATGDFNGDGLMDVVMENYSSNTVSVLLGKGDGTFQPQVTYAVGSVPERVVAADMNGDGNLDLVVANTGGSSVSVLLGNGDGTFQAQATYPCGSPVGLGVMDINHDGIPDVVAGDYYSNTISVLLGNGDGTLKPAVTYATGGTPQTLAEGDFNGDGNVDVVVGNAGGGTVGVFLGNGDGTFATMVTYAVGRQPQGVQVGDFNGDGKQDLAVSNQGDGTVGVLIGNGDGTFQPMVTYAVGVQPVGIAIADFNGDGFEDITVGNTGQASLTQGVLLGNGDGTFQPQVAFPTGNFPYGVAVADFNGDGLPDVAVADWNDGTATILLSQTTETATAAVTGIAPVGAGTHAVVASYAGDAHYGTSVSAATNLVVVTIAPVIAWTPAAGTIGYGTALGAQQLNATATTAAGAAIPGTFVYTPAAGTVLGAGTHTVSVAFTPTDGVDYTAATAAVTITVTQAVPVITWAAPAGITFGTALSATQLDATVAGVGTGALPGTLVYTPAAGTVPAVGTTTLSVAFTPTDAVDYTTATASVPITVVPAVGAATLSGPTTTPPASQPTVTLAITNPYPLALTAQFTLTFAGTAAVDDPSIQFSTGGRTYSYTVAADSTSVPPVELQAGTDAGTITIAAKLMADGVDVTPPGLAPLVIVVPPAVPLISGTTITATGNTLTVVVHGFSNTREVSQAVFAFTAATGDTLATPMVTIPATADFGAWFGSTDSVQYGSTFTYTQVFTTSADASTVGQVKVTLTNSVGVSEVSTSP